MTLSLSLSWKNTHTYHTLKKLVYIYIYRHRENRDFKGNGLVNLGFSTPTPAAQASSGRSLPSPADIEASLRLDCASWVPLGSFPFHNWAYLCTVHAYIYGKRFSFLVFFGYVSNYLWIVYPSISLSLSCPTRTPGGRKSFSLQNSVTVIWSKSELNYLLPIYMWTQTQMHTNNILAFACIHIYIYNNNNHSSQ